MAGIGDLVNLIAGSKVMPDAEDTYKNVIAPATRMVTDVAIDIGDLTTGYQFHGEMESAKQAMDDAGLDTVKTRIEQNHFPELKSLKSTLDEKVSKVGRLQSDLTVEISETENRLNLLKKMNIPFQEILALEEEIRNIQSKIEAHDFKTRVDSRNVDMNVSSKFQTTQSALRWTNAGLGVGSTVGAGIGLLATGTRIAKIGSRAAVVLTVVSIGIDIGMAVVELEEKERQIRDGIGQADMIISDLTGEKQKLCTEKESVNADIRKILTCFNQTENSFFSWAERRLIELKDAVAKEKARLKKVVLGVIGPLLKSQLDFSIILSTVQALDSSITDDICRQYITEINSSKS